MKILLIGEKGQLAWELARTLMPIGDIVPVDYPAFDISNKEQILETVYSVVPDLVINASAYTDVDRAETEKEKAMAINAAGPGWLAEICRSKNIPVIHYSTDFVFDGMKKSPYVETDIPNPINFYGRTKLKGEEAVLNATESALIFRLAWLYSSRGNNFMKKFLEWAGKYEIIKVVDDQVGNPTWARFVAEATASILAESLSSDLPLYNWIKEHKGIYHLTSSGYTSRYEWSCKIWEFASNRENLKIKRVERAKTVDFPTPAGRPAYSALDCGLVKRTFSINIPSWEEQLQKCMDN